MGSGRRSSALSSSGRLPSHNYGSAGAAGALGVVADSSTFTSRWSTTDGYASSGHVPVSYSMPFGLPPALHRISATRDSTTEFAWPAEPPSPHGPPPRSYTPSASAGEDAATASGTVAAAAGGSNRSDPDTAAAGVSAPVSSPVAAEPPRGSLLFGLGGVAAAVALATSQAAEHRASVEEEHLRLEYAMAAMDAAGARTRRHWRRVSRLAEAEAWIGEEEEGGEGGGGEGEGGGLDGGGVWRAGGERLTGLHRECRWKLAGNEHEGQEPGRFRPVLQPVVAPSSAQLQSQVDSSSSSSLSASAIMSMEDVGLQLARKCSRYIVDIVKTEAQGGGLADWAGGAGADASISGGGGQGDDMDDDDEDNDDDDVWGVIGPLTPAAGVLPDDDGSAAPYGAAVGGTGAGTGTGASGDSSTDRVDNDAAAAAAVRDAGSIGVVEEVSSTGETAAARALREAEERRLVEERVRQTVAAVANGGKGEGAGGGARRRGAAGGPRIDLGPGAGRWRMAVAVAAEAVSGLGVSEAVVLVTPKGNHRGRLSLVDKVS